MTTATTWRLEQYAIYGAAGAVFGVALLVVFPLLMRHFYSWLHDALVPSVPSAHEAASHPSPASRGTGAAAVADLRHVAEQRRVIALAEYRRRAR